MLRAIFVIGLSIIGIVASFYGSFNTLMFYFWLAYFRPESWIWYNFLSAFNLSLFCGIFLLISTLFTGVKFRFNLFTGLLFLAAVHSLISALQSNYSSVSLSYWVDFFKVIVISYLITIIIRSEKDFKIALIVISLSLGLEGAKQGWAQLILNPGAANNNTNPVLGDNNGVAVGMLMLVPVLFALYQTTERKLFKYGFLFLAIGVIYRALSTYSRGGFLSFLVMCVIYWLQSKHKVRTLILIVLLAAMLLPVFPQSFWDRMDTITVEEGEQREESSAGRLHYWSVAWEMAKSNRIFGVGHNAYREAYNYYDYSGGRYGRERAAHSAWFGILADWGFIGLVLFLSIYFYSLLCCVRTRNSYKNNPELKSLGIYGNQIAISLITGSVGITFLAAQYLEMLWHFFALAFLCNQILKSQYACHIAKDITENKEEIKTIEVQFNAYTCI